MVQEKLAKIRARLNREAVLKSVLCGLMVGFGVNFLVALICWLCGFNSIWLAIGLGVAGAVIGGVIFYFTAFKPTILDVARRVDSLGLEERIITMIELEKDPSYIAARQREDATARLSKVDFKSIKMAVSRVIIALVCVFFVLGSGMTTVTALAAAGVLADGSTLLPGRNNFLEVSYMVDEGGEIEGDPDQLLMPGEDATPVIAIADEGWVFVGWDDGVKTPFRHDTGVSEGFIVTAIFEQVSEDEEDPGAPGEGEGNDDEAPDGPGSGAGNGEGESDTGQEGGDAGEGNGAGDGGMEGEGDGKGKGNGAGGRYEESNKVIDGDTYYRDELEAYMQSIIDKLESEGELTDEEREFLEKYFGSL